MPGATRHYNEDGYKDLQKQIRSMVIAVNKINTKLKSSDVDDILHNQHCRRLALTYVKKLEQNRNEFNQYCQRLEELETVLISHKRKLDKSEADAKRNMNSVPSVNYECPSFSDSLAQPYLTDFSGYKSYAFYSSGKSYSTDYNDLPAFLESDLYKRKSNLITSGSLLTEWKAYFNPKAYTNEWLETSMKEVLNSLAPKLSGMGEAFKNLGDTELGKEWAEFFKECVKAGKSREDFIKDFMDRIDKNGEYIGDPSIREILRQMSSKDKSNLYDQLYGMLNEKVWENLSDAAENVDTFFEYCEVLSNCVVYSITDFTTHISYLNSMEEALLASGFNRSATVSAIHTLRREYTDAAHYAAKELGEQLSKDIFKELKKNGLKAVPGLGLADELMSTYSKTISTIFSTDVKADKSLMGLQQYDGALTKAYEKYVDLMKLGKATAYDMDQAEKLHTLLGATKRKEYEAMMKMTKKSDPYLSQEYRLKYVTLSNELGLPLDAIDIPEEEPVGESVCPTPPPTASTPYAKGIEPQVGNRYFKR